MTESWRSFFPAAAALAVLGLGAWGAQIAGAPLGILPREHGAFMLWGVLGTGVMGFLYTAYARQNDAPLPGPTLLYGQLAAQLVGAAGLIAGWPGLAFPAWMLVLGWTAQVAWASLRRRWDDTTAAVPAVLAVALAALALHASGGDGTRLAVHGFLVPLALAILDRVLPFFSSRVTPGYRGRRRRWFIGPTLVVSALGALPLPGASAAPWLLLALLARQWWGWAPWPASRTPMIAVLHLGVAWFAAAWGLALAGQGPSIVTHALVIGGLGSLFLGISMRVVRGHGGMPLELGRAGFAVLLLAHLAAVLRISGVPLLAAAVCLILAFGLWLARFLPRCLPVKNGP